MRGGRERERGFRKKQAENPELSFGSYDAWDPVFSPCAAAAKASVSAFLAVYGRREISRKPRDLLGVSNAAEDIT
ncbi:hypothetical protein C0Q70_05678 [Pomacea canaliculata]|uniref:Uncharacterized protein n=1 Tax=Pomacea canaliculata TaxID=400727 RepID=A0A2T7PLV4_POMCA|nr:hypothetical protein C0Q70_05678 [Pomacea canaliculata]